MTVFNESYKVNYCERLFISSLECREYCLRKSLAKSLEIGCFDIIAIESFQFLGFLKSGFHAFVYLIYLIWSILVFSSFF